MANADFKPKWIKWDEDSFRADRIVQRMTPTQRLMYRSLIIECYYNSERPFLPDSDAELWLLADAESIEHWRANKAIILTKFTKVAGSDIPLLQNKRVNEEWADLEKMLADKSKAGAASVAARADRKKKEQKAAAVEQPSNDSPTAVKKNSAAPAQTRPEKKKKRTDQTTPDQTRTEQNSVLSSVEQPLTGVEQVLDGGTDGGSRKDLESTSKPGQEKSLWHRMLEEYRKIYDVIERESADGWKRFHAAKKLEKETGQKQKTVFTFCNHMPAPLDLPRKGIKDLAADIQNNSRNVEEVLAAWKYWIENKYSEHLPGEDDKAPILLPVALFATEVDLYIEEVRKNEEEYAAALLANKGPSDKQLQGIDANPVVVEEPFYDEEEAAS